MLPRVLPALPLLAVLFAAALSGCTCTADPCAGVTCDGGTCVDGTCGAPLPDGGRVCEKDDDCAGGAPRTHCEPASGQCVQCLVAAHCPEPESQICEVATHTCAPRPRCGADADCADLPGTPHCEPDSGRCVVCTEDAQCVGTQQVCRSFTCQLDVCATDADCDPYPGTPICRTTTGRCVECTESAQCPEGEACSQAVCVPVGACSRDADCAAGLQCSTLSQSCVQCVTGDDCSLGGRCLAGTCADLVPCVGDADCTPPTHCAPDRHVCVACTEDAHCGPGQTCNGAGLCEEPATCGADAACLAGRTCDASGACTDAACSDDAFEPNDVPYDATPVEPGTVSGVLCPNAADWYVVRAATGDGVRVRLRYDASAGAPTLLVWSGSGTGPDLLAEPVRTAEGQRVEVAALDRPGPLWIGIEGDEAALAYELEVAVEAGGLCADDAYEPNDASGTAASLPDPVAGVTSVEAAACFGDDDWFVVTTPAGLRTVADAEGLDGPSSTLVVSLFVQDPGGVLRLVGGDGTQHAEAPARGADAAHLVRVTQTVPGRRAYRLTVRLSPPAPANDTCGGAVRLYEGTSASGTTAGATDDGATACGGAGSPDVVWRLDLSSASTVHLSTEGTLDAILGLRADCADPASEVACADVPGDRESLTAVLPAGTWWAWVDGFGGRAGDFALRLDVSPPPPPPANEGCETAAVLDPAAGGGVLTGNLAVAGDEAQAGCGAPGGDAVWALTLDAPASLSLDLAGAPGLSVSVRADCVDGASEAACGAVTAAGGAHLDLPYLAAGTWTVLVDGGGPARGAYELVWALGSPIPPPANEDCATAEVLDLASGAAQVSGDTRNAADDLEAACAVSGSGGGDVVYAFTLDAEQQLTATLTAGFDAVLALRGAACDAASALACDDGRPPRVRAPALAAGTYALVVDGYDGGRGPFTLDVAVADPLPVPANDRCADAPVVDLSGGAAQRTGTTERAANDADPGAACTGSPTAGGDVFYAVDLAAGQALTATVTPAAGFDPALYVLDACGGACVAGADASFVSDPETVTFTAPVAGRYLVVVDGWGEGAAGAFTLDLASP